MATATFTESVYGKGRLFDVREKHLTCKNQSIPRFQNLVGKHIFLNVHTMIVVRDQDLIYKAIAFKHRSRSIYVDLPPFVAILRYTNSLYCCTHYTYSNISRKMTSGVTSASDCPAVAPYLAPPSSDLDNLELTILVEDWTLAVVADHPRSVGQRCNHNAFHTCIREPNRDSVCEVQRKRGQGIQSHKSVITCTSQPRAGRSGQRPEHSQHHTLCCDAQVRGAFLCC
jgi:hypothetical protein